MFKLDFFEYYMLLERGLVHLLGVFGVVVPRDFAPSHQRRQTDMAQSADAEGVRSDHRHRFHANVLAALDAEDSPLREILGQGEVRRQLARAKDLRNRWKNADGLPVPQMPGKEAAPLETYDLEGILTTVFGALDRAYAVAERFASERVETGTGEGVGMDPETRPDEEQWGFMTDAMDWEAV